MPSWPFEVYASRAKSQITEILGHFFLILSLKYADASKLAPFSYFEIITNIIIGFYFFGDFPDKWTFLGLAIIVSAGIYIFRRESFYKNNI